MHPGEALITYSPSNPYQKDPDWPFRGIDHVLVRCAETGPTLLATSCTRVFALGPLPNRCRHCGGPIRTSTKVERSLAGPGTPYVVRRPDAISDHYGLAVDYVPAAPPAS